MNDIRYVRGVGPAMAEHLKTLGIQSVLDIIYYFPRRYDDFSQIVTLSAAPLDTPITVRVTLEKIKTKRAWKRKRFTITEAAVHDASGGIKVIWFNQSYVGEHLKPGELLFLAGKISQDKYGRHFTNPVFERVKTDTTHTARIVPQYRLTKGLTQKQLRYYIKQALTLMQRGDLRVPDWLPPDIRKRYHLADLSEALTQIHFPTDDARLAMARFRLGFDELLPMQLFTRLTRQALAREHALALPFREAEMRTFVAHLPFQLTATQKKVAWEILQDLTQPQPMNRLLEGDVGAGKTVIAVMAMVQVVRAGHQAMLMAPTELLAEQHFQKITELLRPTDITIALVTAHHRPMVGGAQRLSGEGVLHTVAADIIIGTHALLEDTVPCERVALAVIDEQHRFGVAQRQRLKERARLPGKIPHLLSMTATPIPRSLALVLYGDLDISILDELPPGRKPIQTTLIGSEQRRSLYAQVRTRLAAHEQIYIVAPRIRDDDTVQTELASVEQASKSWQQHLPQARLAMLHGQLPAKTKQQLMSQFRHGLLDGLIATTVIEVGVDVPNATVMIIEDADRFGLAQLHQLRGRVGRSDKPSYCYVCCTDPSPAALERLQYFTQTTSGFELAEYDLAKRGPGDVYGEEQSGYLTSLRVARLSDHALLKKVTVAADELLPKLEQYPTIHRRVQAFMKKVHLE